ncbi:hypothetical protein CVT24_005669 [Panaeolus cyanescens]|uniref:Uncharacterized protein n=1 Tax=Panaeolus cyanescens TaxID=181874 RepID=A0A409WHB1_9AGAR|nr:hypothetical protein CVT24_005669 [Panaeolus cyanescens]
MTTPSRQPLTRPEFFNKVLLRQLSPIFAEFNKEFMVTTSIEDEEKGYSIDHETACVIYWGLKRLRRLISLVVTVAALYPGINVDELANVSIPTFVPNYIFEYLHLERPTVMDDINPNHSNPLHVVHNSEEELKASWKRYTSMGREAVLWVEESYARSYSEDPADEMASELEAMSIDDSTYGIYDSDSDMSDSVDSISSEYGASYTPPTTPEDLVVEYVPYIHSIDLSPSAIESSPYLAVGDNALIVHPTASHYAQHHPGFNPFAGTIVRDPFEV